jgi:hypothetical protein
MEHEQEIAGHAYASQVSGAGSRAAGGMLGCGLLEAFPGFCFGAAVLTTGSRAGGLLLPDVLLQCSGEPAVLGDRVLHGQQQRREAGLRDGGHSERPLRYVCLIFIPCIGRLSSLFEITSNNW